MKVIQTTVVTKDGKVVDNHSREITARKYAILLVQIGMLQMHKNEHVEVEYLPSGDVKVYRKLSDRVTITGFQITE